MPDNKKINELIAENIMQWHHDPGSEKLREDCPNGIWRDCNGNGVCHYDSFRPTEQVKEANWVIRTMMEKGLGLDDLIDMCWHYGYLNSDKGEPDFIISKRNALTRPVPEWAKLFVDAFPDASNVEWIDKEDKR